HSYTLDFQLDDQLIMAINPTPNAVGSVMRKAGDILSGNDLAGRKMLVVVDDRSDQLFELEPKVESTFGSNNRFLHCHKFLVDFVVLFLGGGGKLAANRKNIIKRTS
ncbi:hypothetical protein, partial [Avibacterium paragallinarum]|uniref:hypothetical protein n=1 Tax=Avibacterium paragallinarum TaxID=728 RepID=UPI000D4A429B